MSIGQLILLFILDFLFWTPSQFQISLNMSNSRYLTLFNMLWYFPLILAFLVGFAKGKDVFWKVGVVGLFASIISGLFAILDLNRSMEGGWAYYGSWTGLVLTIIIEAVIVAVLAYLGGFLKGKFFK